jgi:hypothetical protein
MISPLKRKIYGREEYNNKKRKIEEKISIDIIRYILIFLDYNYCIDTLQYVNKLFLKCVRYGMITIKDDLNGLKNYRQINIEGSKIDNDTFNKIINGSKFLEILRITNCSDVNDINLNMLSKLKELSLKNCNNLKGDFLNSLSELKTFDSITIKNCTNIKSGDLFKLVSRPLKKIIISLRDNDLSYLDHVNLLQLETINIEVYRDVFHDRCLYNFFKNLTTNNSLHTLTINFCGYYLFVNHDKLLSYTSHLKLKHLNISGGKNMGNFTFKCNFESLETFILYNAYIRTDYLIKILNDTTVLKEFKIGFDDTPAKSILDINIVLKKVKQISTLTYLHLNCTNIYNTGLRYLNKFNLKKLDIYNSYRLSTDCLKYIEDIKLHSLDLKNCYGCITDNSLIYLKNMPLRNLSLYGNSINGKGLIHLKDLPLTSLNLEYTDISGDLSKYKRLFKHNVNIVW